MSEPTVPRTCTSTQKSPRRAPAMAADAFATSRQPEQLSRSTAMSMGTAVGTKTQRRRSVGVTNSLLPSPSGKASSFNPRPAGGSCNGPLTSALVFLDSTASLLLRAAPTSLASRPPRASRSRAAGPDLEAVEGRASETTTALTQPRKLRLSSNGCRMPFEGYATRGSSTETTCATWHRAAKGPCTARSAKTSAGLHSTSHTTRVLPPCAAMGCTTPASTEATNRMSPTPSVAPTPRPRTAARSTRCAPSELASATATSSAPQPGRPETQMQRQGAIDGASMYLRS
mmetsp:Transcript_168171/g.540227  ORF Transcript_168171/g.540227 Transcript_168171/m.540227 type:complete len:286 (+) Transcript_168171:648-1505(+)